jgi:hypothetical protein
MVGQLSHRKLKEQQRRIGLASSNEPKSFVAKICANDLPLVYGWSSVDLRLIYISLFVAVVNAFKARTYNGRQTSF